MSFIHVLLTPPPGATKAKQILVNSNLVSGVSQVLDKTRIWLADGQVLYVIDDLEVVLGAMPTAFVELRSALADNAMWVNPALVAHCIESGPSTEVRMMGGETFLASEDLSTVFHALT